MKLTKSMLRTIIKEQIAQINEAQTVSINTGMNFPPEHRFMGGIKLAYDKSKNLFIGKADGKTRAFKNLPGNFYQGRDSEGAIYAIAFKRMFNKEAPAPKSAAAAEAGGAPSGDSSGPAVKIAKAVGQPVQNIKVGDDMIAIKYSKNPQQSERLYRSRGKKHAVALQKLGFENAEFTGRFDRSFGIFSI